MTRLAALRSREQIDTRQAAHTVDAETLGGCSVSGFGATCPAGERVVLLWPPRPEHDVQPVDRRYGCGGLHYTLESYSALRLVNAGARVFSGHSPVGLTVCEHMVSLVE